MSLSGLATVALGTAHLIAVSMAARNGRLSGALSLHDLRVIGATIVMTGLLLMGAGFTPLGHARWAWWCGVMAVGALAGALVALAVRYGLRAPGPVLPVLVLLNVVGLALLARRGE